MQKVTLPSWCNTFADDVPKIKQTTQQPIGQYNSSTMKANKTTTANKLEGKCCSLFVMD